MKTNNALVTYDDLTTMGLAQQIGANPPVGNQCATKDFILTNYRADVATLAGYASNRLPPYQAIIPTTSPYLACYNLAITTQYLPGCGSYTNEYETWTITLIDQFGNAYVTPTSVDFQVQYYYFWQDDVYPYQESGYQTVNITVNAGQSQGFYQFGIHLYNNCAMSSTCDGSCYSTISQITLISTPGNIQGGCTAPGPTPVPNTRIFIPGGFSPDGNGINDTWKFYTVTNGVYTEMVYSNFPNMKWILFDSSSHVWYQNLTGGVYSPWNNYQDNNTGLAFNPNGTIFYNIDLNDGSGRVFQSFLTVSF